MNILLISDIIHTSALGKNIEQRLMGSLIEKKSKYTHYSLYKEDLKSCIGCFNCWLKTPGICAFDDVGKKIARDYMQSDIVIFISPIKYGCYGVAIRRVMDRLLPNLLPFFKKINNEVHHAPRYNKYPQIVVLGYGEYISDFEVETFKSLSDANAINLMKGEARTYVCRVSEDVDKIIDSLKFYLVDMEDVRV